MTRNPQEVLDVLEFYTGFANNISESDEDDVYDDIDQVRNMTYNSSAASCHNRPHPNAIIPPRSRDEGEYRLVR